VSQKGRRGGRPGPQCRHQRRRRASPTGGCRHRQRPPRHRALSRNSACALAAPRSYGGSAAGLPIAGADTSMRAASPHATSLAKWRSRHIQCKCQRPITWRQRPRGSTHKAPRRRLSDSELGSDTRQEAQGSRAGKRRRTWGGTRSRSRPRVTSAGAGGVHSPHAGLGGHGRPPPFSHEHCRNHHPGCPARSRRKEVYLPPGRRFLGDER